MWVCIDNPYLYLSLFLLIFRFNENVNASYNVSFHIIIASKKGGRSPSIYQINQPAFPISIICTGDNNEKPTCGRCSCRGGT